MTPPDEPPSNPYDPNWPKPEQPSGEPHTQPYGQDPNAQQPPYPPYGQAPYGEQQPSPPQAGQVPYGAPSYGGSGAPPHPSALTALILGLVSLCGILLCAGITLPLAPFAWFIGGRAVKDIDANPGRYSGRDQAQAGRIMGMVGTGLLVLGLLLAVVAIVVIAVAAGDTSTLTNDPTIGESSDSTF